MLCFGGHTTANKSAHTRLHFPHQALPRDCEHTSCLCFCSRCCSVDFLTSKRCSKCPPTPLQVASIGGRAQEERLRDGLAFSARGCIIQRHWVLSPKATWAPTAATYRTGREERCAERKHGCRSGDRDGAGVKPDEVSPRGAAKDEPQQPSLAYRQPSSSQEGEGEDCC